MRLVGWIMTVVALVMPRAFAQVRHDVIDPDRRFQVIENFSASEGWSIQKIGLWSDPARNKVADLLFTTDKGIGLSCWRFNIGAGINRVNIRSPWRTLETFETGPGQYDWTRQPGERWFLAAAKARGVNQFLAFVCSPPARMTRSGLTNSGNTPGSTNLKDGYEGQFARYLADIMAHFRDNPDEAERIDFNYLSPINEPEWDWKDRQEGCRMANRDIKKVVEALGPELEKRGLKTQITIIEAGNARDLLHLNDAATKAHGAEYGDYIDALCGDPQVARWMGKRLSYHSYWTDQPNALLKVREPIAEAMARRFPGWKLWMSEYCVMEHGRDLGIDTALRVARTIWADLAVADVSAWQWWRSISEADYKDGLIYTDWHKPGDEETIHPSKILWALGNYSRFIRPGMRRIQLTGPQDLASVMASAYAGENRKLVVVYVNESDKDQEVELSIRNGGPVQWTPWVTSAGEDLQRHEPVPPGQPLRLPARSIVTLVSDPR